MVGSLLLDRFYVLMRELPLHIGTKEVSGEILFEIPSKIIDLMHFLRFFSSNGTGNRNANTKATASMTRDLNYHVCMCSIPLRASILTVNHTINYSTFLFLSFLQISLKYFPKSKLR